MLLKTSHLIKSISLHKFKRFFILLFSFRFSELIKKISSSIKFKKNENRLRNLISDISPDLVNSENNYRYFIYKNFKSRDLKNQKIFSDFSSNKGGEWKYNNNKVAHYYADYYGELLDNESVKNVLEIGIGHFNESPGGSLKGFKKMYPNANIYGIDNQKKVLFSEDRIKTYCVDQYNINELKKFKNELVNIEFDLIIDDGAHTYLSHINSFEILFEKISMTGRYIIEDLEFDYLDKYYNYFSKKPIDFKIVEFINFNNKDCQCLIEIKKI